MYYLAYGSNLNKEQMRRRCPTARVVGTSKIENYKLLFKGSKTGAYLTIEQEIGESVPVAVWKVRESDVLSLDRYEGYPNFYYKKEMQVVVKGKVVNAFVYIMHEDRKIAIPSIEYLLTCKIGYIDFNFNLTTLQNALQRSFYERERN